MKKISLAIYVLAAAAVLTASLVSIRPLYLFSKPLLMPALVAYYFSASLAEERSRPLILALIFSLVGDVLLMSPDYFIPGLIAFLITHALYIIVYRQHRYEETEVNIQGLQRMRLAFPIILGGTGLITVLYPVLGDLKFPLIIYAIVLMIMVVTAIFRMGRTSSASFWAVFGGAALFMISDATIAINKFLEPFSLAEFWIMITYIVAQFMIVKGLLIHQRQ